jgi:hypothetical protein
VKVKLTGFKPVEKKVDAAAAVPVELRFELQKGVANLKKTTRFSTYNYIGSITVNPLMLVGGLIHAQYEHAMGESFGAVGGLAIQLPFAASQGGGLWVHGGVNYYFGHVGGEEFDGFHAGARLLLGVSSQFGAGVGFGLLGGYKFIFGPGITISAGLGFDVIGTTRGPVPLPIVEADAGWSF